jgi:hypothetical protein
VQRLTHKWDSTNLNDRSTLNGLDFEQKGSLTMQAHYPDQTLPAMAPSHPDTEQHEAGHLVYQGTTILAILLFLISFWSC